MHNERPSFTGKKVKNYICNLLIHIKRAHFIKTRGMQKGTIYQIANLAPEKERKN